MFTMENTGCLDVHQGIYEEGKKIFDGYRDPTKTDTIWKILTPDAHNQQHPMKQNLTEKSYFNIVYNKQELP